MKIDETIRHGVVIIRPRGKLMLETVDAFSETVRRHLAAGEARLILDLAQVSSIDSCGLGAIAQTCVSARCRGGDVKLLHVSGRNLDLLTITKLVTMVETLESEEHAERLAGSRLRSRREDQEEVEARPPSIG